MPVRSTERESSPFPAISPFPLFIFHSSLTFCSWCTARRLGPGSLTLTIRIPRIKSTLSLKRALLMPRIRPQPRNEILCVQNFYPADAKKKTTQRRERDRPAKFSSVTSDLSLGTCLNWFPSPSTNGPVLRSDRHPGIWPPRVDPIRSASGPTAPRLGACLLFSPHQPRISHQSGTIRLRA